MEYVNLGNTGLKVSRICLGMMSYGTSKWRPWVLDEDDSRPIIQHAVEQGINFFDTANMYANGVSEEVTGRALRDFCQRDEIVLATKVYFPTGDGQNQRGLSRKHILAQVDESLRRLGMDYIDLYQIHRFDYTTPIEETMEALHDVVKSGKVRYIGASSMFAWEFSKMNYTAKLKGQTPFVTMQNHYNLIYREEEREMLPLCADLGVGVIPWSPLARGLLTRPPAVKDTARATNDPLADAFYTHPSDTEVIRRNAEVADRMGMKPAQIALAWMLHNPVVSAPIIGATKQGYLDDAVAALDIRLDAETIAYLEEAYQPHAIAGHSYGNRDIARVATTK